MNMSTLAPKPRWSALVAIGAALVALVTSTQTALSKSITFNNGSGSGLWNFTDNNWTLNPYADGDTVTFNTATWAGPVTIAGNVAPASLIILGSGWASGIPNNTPVTFSGGDIVGTASVNVNQDKAGVFTQDNLSFSGGTFLTSNGATIRHTPPSAGFHWFGSGPITISHNSTTFQFNPVAAGSVLSNDFVITSAATAASWVNMNPGNGGVLGGTLTINAGGGLNLTTGTLSQKTILKGNTILAVCNNGGGTGFILGQIVSDGGPHNLTLSSSGNGDHRTQLSGSLPWAVRNVERKVASAGTWGTVFIANQDVLFSQLAANNGAFIQTSGTTSFGTVATPDLNPLINFPLTVNGGGFFGASTVNLNLVNGGVLGGSGAILRTASYSTASFNTNVNVKLNPASTLALAGGSIGSNTVVGTLSANGGTVSGSNGNATVYGTTTINSGSTTFTLPNASLFTGLGLARSAGATALFRGANLGSTAKATFTSGTGMTGGIIPWARAATSDSGTGETFAAYGANGFTTLASYDATDDLSVSGNVDLTAVNTLGSSDPDATVNALRLSSGGGVSLDSARKLTITSGGILALGGNAGIAGGTLAFGSAEGILHTLGDLAVSSAITGSGGLAKDGAGGLTLSGANSLGSGATAVNAGRLTLGSSSAIGTGTLTVQPGAVVDVAGYSPTVAGISDNAGHAVGGIVTNSGGTATLTINNTGAQTFSGRLIGNMSLVKNGAGTQTLSGDNAYPGGTTLNAGTLAAGHDNAFSTGGLTISGGTLQGANGARTLTNAITVSGNFIVGGSSALTLTQPIALTGNRTVTVNNTGLTTFAGGLSEDIAGRTLTKAGAGTLILPEASTYSGATTISDGALRADDGDSLPSASLLVFNGGNNAVLETSGTFIRTVGTASGNVQWLGHGGFAAYGAPLAVRLNNGSGTVTWNSGSFVPNGKYLNFGSTTADNVVTFENAINLNNANRVINVVDNASSTADYAVISGSITNGSITKANTGTLRLSGVNTYAGGTHFLNTVNANGTVEITNDQSLGTGPITIGYGYVATVRNVSGGVLNLVNKVSNGGAGGSQHLILGGNDFNMTGDLQLNNGQGNITVQSGTKAVFSGSILSTGFNVNGPGTLEFTGPNSGSIIALQNFARVGMGTDFGPAKTKLEGQSSMTLYAIGGPRTFTNAIALGGYGGNTHYFAGTNAITFTGPITDESGGSNRGYNLNVAEGLSVTFSSAMPGSRGNSDNYYMKSGLGLLVFSGTSSYTFRTLLAGGVLRAKDGVGLPTTSYLRLDGGVLESDGIFNRTLAAHPANTANGDSQFRWNGSAGFSAFGGPLTVNINGGGADTFTWASTANFLGSAHTLVLGSTNANDVVTLVDHINLNAANRTVQVNDNPATDADYAVLAGNLSGTGASALTKSGSGTLVLNGVNTYPGATTVTAGGIGGSGSLAGNLVFNAGTRFRAVVGQPLTVNGLTIGADCTIDVTNAGTGTVLTYTGTLSGTFANAVGVGGRIVSYATPGQIKLLSPGTILLLR